MFDVLFEEESPPDQTDPCHEKTDCCATNMQDSIPPPPRLMSHLCGIYNQGATCYLNSLLQTLLMTPEFRESLFQLGATDLGMLDQKDKLEAKVRVIPIQLQRLFARLLLLDAQGTHTTELTDSFGWTNKEELQQHDVQELNRILFGAIEESLVGTAGQNLIKDFYRGMIVNQIICQECKNISEREEEFLDICVSVAGNDCLTSGLQNCYVETELMEGKNKYRCERCKKLVNATKGAKLRHLPKILTVSLLRFSFDLRKMERYKEIGKFSFPTKLNMKDYCENLPCCDNDAEYELFSVVIHRGSTHGGHYHAYIRDIDGLGQWAHPDVEDIQVATDPETGKVDFIEYDSPIELVQAVLAKGGVDGMPVDKLCAELVKQTGVSWNKRFKRQHGPVHKFLKKYDDKFVFNSDTNWVSLNHGGVASTSSEDRLRTSNIAHNTAPEARKTRRRPLSPLPGAGYCWFDFDDSRVHPIRTKDIEKQFSGKESAYMLFYRSTALIRPAEAMHDPSFHVPLGLKEEVAVTNSCLQEERRAYETKKNTVRLQVHFDRFYTVEDDVLQPVDDLCRFLELCIDRRKNIQDLKGAIVELGGDMVCEEFCIHIAKELPAGLHLYQPVPDDDVTCTLMSQDIGNNTCLFIWDGQQVGGETISVGEDYEPVMLTIQYGNPSQITRAFPKNLTIGELRLIIQEKTGVDVDDMQLGRFVTTGEDTKVFNVWRDENQKTLSEMKVRDGDRFLVQDMDDRKLRDMSENAATLKTFLVENRCSGTLDGNWPVLHIDVDRSATVEELKVMILSQCQTENVCRLRVDDDNHGLGPPLQEQQSITCAGLKSRDRLVLEYGSPPLSSQITLTVSSEKSAGDKRDIEVTVNKNSRVEELLQICIVQAHLSGDDWHLQRTNWCGEPTKVLDDLDSTLIVCQLNSGDHLLLVEGKLPPKGFMKLVIWLLPSIHSSAKDAGMMSWMTRGISGLFDKDMERNACERTNVGDIIISKQATLEMLKLQIMDLPLMKELPVPTARFLRVSTLKENGQTGTVLRTHSQQLQRFKLPGTCQLAIQVLPSEEDLNQNQLLLYIRERIAGTRTYKAPQEFVWDQCKGVTARALRHAIGDVLSKPFENVYIAKHFEDKFEWLIIKDFAPSKGKHQKGKKKSAGKMNVKHSPYFIKDSDVIGVKTQPMFGLSPSHQPIGRNPLLQDLLANTQDKGDFGTAEDDIGKEKQKQEAEEKRLRREEAKKQQSALDTDASGNKTKPGSRPETGIRIHVADFR